MSKMNHKVMSAGVLAAAIKALGISAPKAKNVVALANALSEHFAKATPKKELSGCSSCGGVSDIKLPSCPYCGDADIIGEGATVTTTAEAVLESAPAAKQAEQPTQSGGYVVLKVEDLDASLGRVAELKKNAERSIWELGAEIRALHDGELWKARVGDGKQTHKTWKQFCAAELEMSHSHAYRLIDVATKFTREQVEKWGVAKLTIIAQLPDARADELLKGDKDTTAKKLQREANALKEKGDKEREAGDQVTVVVRVKKRLKLKMQGSNGKPAQSLADDPWVEHEYENGVVQRFAVVMDPKTSTLELVLTTRRA